VLRVGVAGASGYSGVELVKILLRHPRVKLTVATSEQSSGQPLAAIFPHLRGLVEIVTASADPETLARECDVVFTALPHGVPMKIAPAVLAAGKKLIDLGADFRLRDASVYESWYKVAHTAADLLPGAVYGLPELNRSRITAGVNLVANPGCYPTSCALAAAPLLRAGVVDPRSIIFDSKSGVSGAGRGAKVANLYGEVAENFSAYGIAGTHRHTPEIEQTLSDLTGQPVLVSFTPHLVPMTRGILTTAYFQLTQDLSTEQVLDLFRAAYEGEPFVRVRPAGELPQTKHVAGSNFCDIGAQVDRRTGRVLVIAVIDNLVKGAAGQAVQNMNLLAGFPETLGLETLLPVYP
jgi:N-acetyl-gamma-glutamyl-phosphate reductase